MAQYSEYRALYRNKRGLRLDKPESSVVNITQIMTVNKSELKKKIGQLPAIRTEEIVIGLEFLFKPRQLGNFPTSR